MTLTEFCNILLVKHLLFHPVSQLKLVLNEALNGASMLGWHLRYTGVLPVLQDRLASTGSKESQIRAVIRDWANDHLYFGDSFSPQDQNVWFSRQANPNIEILRILQRMDLCEIRRLFSDDYRSYRELIVPYGILLGFKTNTRIRDALQCRDSICNPCREILNPIFEEYFKSLTPPPPPSRTEWITERLRLLSTHS